MVGILGLCTHWHPGLGFFVAIALARARLARARLPGLEFLAACTLQAYCVHCRHVVFDGCTRVLSSSTGSRIANACCVCLTSTEPGSPATVYVGLRHQALLCAMHTLFAYKQYKLSRSACQDLVLALAGSCASCTFLLVLKRRAHLDHKHARAAVGASISTA